MRLLLFFTGFLVISTNAYSATKPNQWESRIKVYTPSIGIQQDDSQFIDSNNLALITRFVSGCDGRANPWSFVIKGVYERNDNSVYILSNKPLCVADTPAIKRYLDEAIEINKNKSAERASREIEWAKRDPKRPYALGCEAYKRSVRGLDDIPTIDIVKKLYPKLNPIYVTNLWSQGYRHAQSYGMANVDCKYLADISGV
ncbi:MULTISPECIES: hypothetical protein [Yersinia]|uniref:hypothetical protein n=1 Tax=Yersinia TaxID=629 RepID=UPI00065A85C1|nr:hypothetical protein [Yersinia enterocolitica]PNM16558.1 hypothetical protein A6J63_012080 [Yersinia enterocolitica]CRY38423.1 Uncharacterised protein [Yersinia enterocolitica]HDL7837447.1 hypothetical protein [Yersinia enterocolitica]HDL8434060.1 hypothetical protein [Yersinia enterocolitica]HDL8487707.1 hypothetical protein [Yersinia enterocolitica]